MSTQNIKQDIYKIISESAVIDIKTISDNKDMLNDLDMDSLDFLYILMKCEDKFNIHITDAEMEKIKTVNDLTNLVNLKIGLFESKLNKLDATLRKINADYNRRQMILDKKLPHVM